MQLSDASFFPNALTVFEKGVFKESFMIGSAKLYMGALRYI